MKFGRKRGAPLSLFQGYRQHLGSEPICMSLKGGGVTFAGIFWSALAKSISLLKSLTRGMCLWLVFSCHLLRCIFNVIGR